MQPKQPFRSAMFKLPSCEYGMEAPQTNLTKQWSIQQTPVMTPIGVSSINTPVLNLMPSADFLDLNAGAGCNINDNTNQYYDESSDENEVKGMGIESVDTSSSASNPMTESTENGSYTESELAQINDDLVLAVELLITCEYRHKQTHRHCTMHIIYIHRNMVIKLLQHCHTQIMDVFIKQKGFKREIIIIMIIMITMITMINLH